MIHEWGHALLYKIERHVSLWFFHSMDYYDLRQAALAAATASVIYALYQRYNRPSVKDIPGPPNPSWVHGRPRDLVSLCILLSAFLKDINGIG